MFKLADLEVQITIGRKQVVIPGEHHGYERYIKDIDFHFYNKRDVETDIDDENLTTIENWLTYKVDVDKHDYGEVVKVFKDVIMKGDLIYENSWNKIRIIKNKRHS